MSPPPSDAEVANALNILKRKIAADGRGMGDRFDAVVVERVLGTCPKALRRRHKERVGLVLKNKWRIFIFYCLFAFAAVWLSLHSCC